MTRKIIFGLLLTIVISLGLTPSITYADHNSPSNPRTLKSASELDYPPFALVRSDGSADGFSVELLRAVVQELNMEVDIPVGPWHEIKQQLTEGRLDVLPLVAYTPERDTIYDFTVPYLVMHGTIFVRKGEKSISTEADLKDKEVLVMRDDASHEYAVSKKIPAKLILTDTFEEAMWLLSAGKHDAILCQYLMGLQLIKKLGISNVVSVSVEQAMNLRPASVVVSGFEQKFCFAVPDGNHELLAHLNEGLAIVFANGTYDRLYKKWFGPILPKPSVSPAQIIKYLLFILIPILFLGTIVGVWYLRREVARKTEYLKREIRDREKAEEALEERIRFVDILIDATALSTWISDENGTAIKANPACYKFFGATEEEVIGKYNVFKDEVAEKQGVMPEIKRAYATGEPVRFFLDYDFGEVDHVNVKNASHKFIQVILTPIKDKNGKVANVVSQSIDLTDIKRAEEDIKQLAKFPSENPNPVLRVGTDGIILYANKNSDLVLKKWGCQVGDQIPEDYYQLISEILETGTVKTLDLVCDDQIFSMTFAPVVDSAYVNIYGLNITLQKKAEKEKEAFEVRLRQSHKMEALGTMAGGMAHEFNNILGIILGSVELALDDVMDSDPVYARLKTTITATKRARDIVKQVLIFTRQSEFNIQSIQPGFVISESLHLIKSTAPSSIKFVQDLSEIRGSLMADRTQVGQLLMNLCSNAVDAMHGRGTLKISMSEVDLAARELARPDMVPGKYLKLSVSDTGEGMDKATRERMFDPFFTTKDVGKGTGMGLSVVKGIVENSNGMIEVDSAPGKGTTIHVYFPLSEEKPVAEIIEGKPLPTGNERILFVDDEEDLAAMVGMVLGSLGYSVTSKTSSIDALETFRARPDRFDLIITDQTMPDMTGDELATELLKIRPDIPIIMCTGYSSFVPDEKARELGIREYCLKPLDRKVLAQTVRKVLDEK